MNKKILTVTLNPCVDKTITIEGFEYGGLNRAKNTRVDVGGKGINVAKVLSSFDASVFAFGIVAGKQGQEVISFLDDKGIPNSFIKAKGETRTNYKVFDNKCKIITEINEQGFCVNEVLLEECVNNIIRLLPETEIMVLSGSVPSGVDDGIYKRLIDISKKYDVKVILDADGDKLKLGIEALPYAIKPNVFEFEKLVGRKLKTNKEIITAAREYIDMGISMIIISMGAEGAIFLSDNEVYMSTPFPVDCKSTVGAGDSMVAALAYGLKQGYTLEEIARLATAAGSVTASKEGSNVCSIDEVKEKVSLVQLKKL